MASARPAARLIALIAVRATVQVGALGSWRAEGLSPLREVDSADLAQSGYNTTCRLSKSKPR